MEVSTEVEATIEGPIQCVVDSTEIVGAEEIAFAVTTVRWAAVVVTAAETA